VSRSRLFQFSFLRSQSNVKISHLGFQWFVAILLPAHAFCVSEILCTWATTPSFPFARFPLILVSPLCCLVGSSLLRSLEGILLSSHPSFPHSSVHLDANQTTRIVFLSPRLTGTSCLITNSSSEKAREDCLASSSVRHLHQDIFGWGVTCVNSRARHSEKP
jgi:hypothetical protein